MQRSFLQLRVSFVMAAFAIASTACGGPAKPKITRVVQMHNGTTTATWDVTYNGNAIEQMTVAQSDGTITEQLDFSYSDNQITSIDVSNPSSSSQSAQVTLSYNSSGDISEVKGAYTDGQTSMTESSSYAYTNNRIDHITGSQNGQQLSTTRFHWDSKNRVDSLVDTTTDGSSSETMSLTYDDGNDTLQRMDDTYTDASGSTSDAYTLGYTNGTHIDQVALEGGQDTYRVTYNSDNRIDSVTETSGSDTYTTKYTYGNGDVDGMMPVPDFVVGDFFDMQGQRLDTFYPLNSLDIGLLQ